MLTGRGRAGRGGDGRSSGHVVSMAGVTLVAAEFYGCEAKFLPGAHEVGEDVSESTRPDLVLGR